VTEIVTESLVVFNVLLLPSRDRIGTKSLMCSFWQVLGDSADPFPRNSGYVYTHLASIKAGKGVRLLSVLPLTTPCPFPTRQHRDFSENPSALPLIPHLLNLQNSLFLLFLSASYISHMHPSSTPSYLRKSPDPRPQRPDSHTQFMHPSGAFL
jgi:hypothetical protein